MTLHSLRQRSEGDFAIETDLSVIPAIRLVLAGTVLVAYLIDIPGQVSSHRMTWAVIGGYLLYSALLFGVPRLNSNAGITRYVHWADLAWYGLLTMVTDAATGGVFLFYFFAILATAFRQGLRAGIAITLASAAIYITVLALATPEAARPEPMTVFLRVFFLISLGSMIAVWGGSELACKRRLALLREMNGLSNPRFGIDQGSLDAVTKLRLFFGADACLIVMRDDASAGGSMREYSANAVGQSENIPAEMAEVLVPAGEESRVLLQDAGRWHRRRSNRSQAWDPATGVWAALDHAAGAAVAGLLNADAWMSAPLRAGNEKGRIYLVARDGRFGRGDAVFFMQAVEQVFRLIAHVRALDRLASGAAAVERGRIVTDLHDTAIQPYIGLRIGLAALRTRVADTDLLAEPLDKMLKMTTAVILDLRSYVSNLERHQVGSGGLLAVSLKEMAARFEEFHGVAVELRLQQGLNVGDRLAVEVLQLVREGLSNVHRHTRARQCTLALSCEANRLRIDIGNPPDADGPATVFSPRSLLRRTEALGGSIDVRTDAGRGTVVAITIPV